MRLAARQTRGRERATNSKKKLYFVCSCARLVSCFAANERTYIEVLFALRFYFGLSHYLALSLLTFTDCLATIKLATDLAHAATH